MRPHRTRRHLTLIDPSAPPPITGAQVVREWLRLHGDAQLGIATGHQLARAAQELLDRDWDPAQILEMLTWAWGFDEHPADFDYTLSELARCRDYGIGALIHGYGERRWQR